MALVDRYGAFIIDLDGVLYLLTEEIPGSSDAVNKLHDLGKRFVFLTNNSSATPAQYVSRIGALGIDVSEDQIVTSSQAAGHYLDVNCRVSGKRAFVIGETGLKVELESRGLELTVGEEARNADFVFVGWDRSFDFEKLKTAVIAIRRGAEYIAMNVDSTYPTPEGLWPGAGSIVAAVSEGSGREPIVAGKPNPLIVELALERMGASANETIMIGDRLDTDIEAGLSAGVDTLLVLTGVSSIEDVNRSGIRPTHVLEKLAAIFED